MTAPLSPRIRVGYAAGSLSTGAFSTVPGLLLLPYLTDTIGVGAALAGLLVLLPKAWDVLLNPIAGRISDRSNSTRGPRRPFLLAAGIALAVLFAAMFAHPFGGTVPAASYVTVAFIAAATAYAFYQVPYVAMPAEITTDPAERTSLMTRRIAVLAVAILAAGAGAPAIRDGFGGITGYRLMGLTMGALILLGALWAYFGTARAPVGQSRSTSTGWRDTFAAVRAAPRFARLLVVFIVQAVGIGTMLAGVDYVARIVLGSPGASSLLFAAFVGPALVFMPIWQLAAKRYSKTACYLAASLLFGLGAIGIAIAALSSDLVTAPLEPALVTAGDDPYPGGPSTALVIAMVVIIGIGYAGQQVFPLSLLADLSAEAETASGSKRAGLFAGVWTAGETLGMALGPGLYGVILAIGGYLSATGTAPDAAVIQPTSAIAAVAIGFTVIPAIFVLAPLPLLRRVEPEGL